MARTEAILLAHGSPSDPAPQDDAMKRLAAQVESLLPGACVKGATLAAPHSFERALEGLRQPWVYPFFMASGYFTCEVIPRRLAKHAGHYAMLPPFGADPALPQLVASYAEEEARRAGLEPCRTTLVLAAHGSQLLPASRQATQSILQALRAGPSFDRIAIGFIEEEPHLETVARGLERALCLPLFALRAGHVEQDVPQALQRAGFKGRLLDPIGFHPHVPALIARALAQRMEMAAA